MNNNVLDNLLSIDHCPFFYDSVYIYMDNDYDTVTKAFTAAATVNITFTECRVVLFNNTSTNDGIMVVNIAIGLDTFS